MSAVEKPRQLHLPVKAERRKRSRTLTARDRVDMFGHLTAQEKQTLRLRVDAALRDKYRVPATGSMEVRTRCAAITGAFGLDLYCRNLALPGSAYCRTHGIKACG